MIDWVVNCLYQTGITCSIYDKFIFICQNNHWWNKRLRRVLKSIELILSAAFIIVKAEFIDCCWETRTRQTLCNSIFSKIIFSQSRKCLLRVIISAFWVDMHIDNWGKYKYWKYSLDNISNWWIKSIFHLLSIMSELRKKHCHEDIYLLRLK